MSYAILIVLIKTIYVATQSHYEFMIPTLISLWIQHLLDKLMIYLEVEGQVPKYYKENNYQKIKVRISTKRLDKDQISTI